MLVSQPWGVISPLMVRSGWQVCGVQGVNVSIVLFVAILLLLVDTIFYKIT